MENKVIVITGAGRGLGAAMAQLCRARGATVITTDIEEGADFKVDVSREEEMKKMAREVVERHGRIDIWINNAGVWMPKMPIEEVDIERARRLMDINFFGTFFGMRSALSHMRERNEGVIVNILSTTALDGMQGSSGALYVASKYAIRGLIQSVRQDPALTSVKILAVYPGGMKTEIFKGNEPEIIDQFMSPESVAEKIVENLEKENPEEDLIIKGPWQK